MVHVGLIFFEETVLYIPGVVVGPVVDTSCQRVHVVVHVWYVVHDMYFFKNILFFLANFHLFLF